MTERLFNSPSEGLVFIDVVDGEIVGARYEDSGREGEPSVGKLGGEFRQNDGANDPVGTAPPATPTPLDTAATTALSGHLVQGFPNEAAPANPINRDEALEIAVEQGVPEAVEQDNDGVHISEPSQVQPAKKSKR